MRVLVLGLGFVATNLALCFRRERYDVYVTYRSLDRVKRLMAETLLDKRVKLVNTPALNRETLSKLISEVRPHIVVNCVGKIAGSEHELKEAHIEIPRRLCEIVLEVNPETIVLHISTAYVVGMRRPVVVEEEPHLRQDLVRPQTLYEKTKAEGERIVKQFAEHGLRVVILRPVVMYGAFCHHPEVNILFRLAERGLYLQSRRFLSMLNVENFCETVLDLLTRVDALCGKHVILSEDDYTLDELSSTLHRVVKPRKVIRIPLDIMPTLMLRLLAPRGIRPFLKYLDASFQSRYVVVRMVSDLEDGFRKQYEFLRGLA